MSAAEGVRIITNHHERLLIDAYELSADERADFDYLDWPGIDEGTESATFFRYRGQLYDLGEFMTTRGMPEFSPLVGWDAYCPDSFVSGIVVKLSEDGDYITVGLYLA